MSYFSVGVSAMINVNLRYQFSDFDSAKIV